MTKLKLGPLADDRPVKLAAEVPAAVHRDPPAAAAAPPAQQEPARQRHQLERGQPSPAPVAGGAPGEHRSPRRPRRGPRGQGLRAARPARWVIEARDACTVTSPDMSSISY